MPAQSVARAIITDGGDCWRNRSTVAAMWKNQCRALRQPAPAAPDSPLSAEARHDLSFFNGLGGFTPDGREYVITTTQDTPRLRVNVLANPHFGTVISENGLVTPGARTPTNSVSLRGTTTR